MATIGRHFLVHIGKMKISEYHAPLGKSGNTAYTYALMQRLGRHYLGIPHLGTHSFRNMATTLFPTNHCKSGGSVKDPEIDFQPLDEDGLRDIP